MRILTALALMLFTLTFFVPVNSYARMSCGSNSDCCNGLGSCEGGQCKGCGRSFSDVNNASSARVASRQICNAKGCADPSNSPPQSNKAQ